MYEYETLDLLSEQMPKHKEYDDAHNLVYELEIRKRVD